MERAPELYLTILSGSDPDTAIPVFATGDPEIIRDVARALMRRFGICAVPQEIAAQAPPPLRVLNGGGDREGPERLTETVLTVLREAPDGLTTRAVRARVQGRNTEIDRALRELEENGKVEWLAGPRGAHVWRVARESPGRPTVPGRAPEGRTRWWERFRKRGR